jgi:very-short-patch-repair endonuclease
MAGQDAHSAWMLARRQHWVVTHRQLARLGFTRAAIAHRLKTGRLFPIHTGVYAVGRRQLSQEGYFIAAVLACGDHAVLSHESAAVLWGILKARMRMIEISVPIGSHPRRPGIRVHRRKELAVTRRKGIPITTPIQTLIDIAPRLDEPRLERAVNEAMNGDLTTPDHLRDAVGGQPALRTLLDRDTFVLTDTELEQRFVPIARKAGLPKPQSQVEVNGYRVDFFFEELGIVVEADSLRFHRTASQQRTGILRDQAHFKAGLLPLRFTHWQISFDAGYVEDTLRAASSRFRTLPVLVRGSSSTKITSRGTL